MRDHPLVNLTFEILEDEAHLIAIFLRRAGYTTYRLYAQNDDEGYSMFAAAETLRRALLAAGFDPR